MSSVSAFFRDPGVGDALRGVLAELTAAARPPGTLRVWVPGCADGEEAYCIAAMLAGLLGARLGEVGVAVFATDLNARAIAAARLGVYPCARLAGLDVGLRERFFAAGRDSVRATRTLRELCLFAEHDLLRHPPFTRMDFVSCRNLPIDFDTRLQEGLGAKFHASLNPGGLLLLGPSGCGGTVTRLFEPLDAAQRIYRRRDLPTSTLSHGTWPGTAPPQPRPVAPAQEPGTPDAASALGDLRRAEQSVSAAAAPVTAGPATADELRLELQATRAHLHAVIGELESSNAELHSRNEALQGATAELEASNEELRAGNEELRTVNEALQAKTDELVRLNALLNASDITERKRTERALADSEARYRALVETSFDWMWEMDSRLTFTFASRQIAESLGYQPDEVLGRTPFDLMPPAEAARVRALFDAIAAQHQPFYRLENVNLHQDGREVIVETSGVPIFAPDGTWRGYRGFDRDVTANRKATTDLAAERRRLRTLIDAVPDLIWLKDPRGVYLFCNRPFERLYGAPEVQIVGRTDRDFVPAEVADAFLADDRRAIESGHLITTREWLTFTDDGHQALHETIKTPIYDPQGEVLGVLGIARDITALNAARELVEQSRQRLEDLVAARTAELTRSEDQLRLILESSADGLIGLDARGTVTFTNPAAEALLGYAAGALLGRDLHAAIHHTRADGTPEPPALCPIVEVLKTGRTARVEHDVFWRADGSALPVAFSSRPMRRDEAIVGAVVAFSDATRRQEVEQAREQARAEAERLARIKSEFLANMSHEIRTPLNGVLGMAQIGYRASRAHPRLHENFARILDSGKLLLSVVNDILDFSKIEAGKLRIERVAIAPGPLVEEVAASFRERAQDQGIALLVSKAPELPGTWMGDPVRLSQILQNLLGNAIKFTREGRVTLSLERVGENLVFQVDDTGIGMTEDQLGRLFTPFEQAETGTTRTFGGTGLGLAITRRLVELMAGDIRVTSQPGQGSSFQVWLPGTEAGGAPVPDPKHWAVPAGGARLAGLRMLVAEDNEVNRAVLEEMLAAEGALVTLVDNGRRALAAVAAPGATWDAVLMDVQMPEMDGLEATRRILELAPALPVIGQTAHALAQEREKCRAAGMVAQVSKPIEFEDLVATVLRHARRAGRAPATAPAPRGPAPPVSRGAATTPGDGVDWAGLAQRYKGNTAFIDRIAGLALNGHGALPADLRRWVAAGELAQVGAAAHALKGVTGNLMAAGVTALAEATQRAVRTGAADAPRLALQLADAVDGFLTALEAHLKRAGAGR